MAAGNYRMSYPVAKFGDNLQFMRVPALKTMLIPDMLIAIKEYIAPTSWTAFKFPHFQPTPLTGGSKDEYLITRPPFRTF